MGNHLSFLDVLANEDYSEFKYEKSQQLKNKKNINRGINPRNTRKNNFGNFKNAEYLNKNNKNKENPYLSKIIIDLYEKLPQGYTISSKKREHFFGPFETFWLIFVILAFILIVVFL